MAVSPIPAGYHTITPYLIVDDVSKLLTFVESALGAKVTDRHEGEDGAVNHASVRVGDSMLMMGASKGVYNAMPTMLYLYVEDCDATYKRALEAGAENEREPQDEFYGDRTSGVLGPCGNHWWFATHIEDLTPEEMAARAAKSQGAG